MDRRRAKTRLKKDEEAEMGVGTLIVFIAMILVAAVAATVLITTAFKMQQQAEYTGEIAIADVATGFKVVNLAGDRDNPDDSVSAGVTLGSTDMIEILEIKVGLMAGSPDINVSDVLIEVMGESADVTLRFVDTGAGENYSGKASATQFTIEPLRDMAPVNSSDAFAMMTAGDVAKFYINTNATGLQLFTQSSCTIKIIPKHGVPTLVGFTTPAVYTRRYLNL